MTTDDGIAALLACGFIMAFLLSFVTGAHDVANAFGTSYGAGVLAFWHICIFGSIFETIGSVVLGGKVADTMERGIANIDLYHDNIYELTYGYLAALIGSTVWLGVTIFFKLPVSSTHSTVGAIIGFTMVVYGPSGVYWDNNFTGFDRLVVSWFVSPVMSGIISSIVFLLVKFFVIKNQDPVSAACRLLPLLYGLMFAVISFMIISECLKTYGDQAVKTILVGGSKTENIWIVALIAIGLGCIACVVLIFTLMPWIKRNVNQQLAKDEERRTSTTQTSANDVENNSTPDTCWGKFIRKYKTPALAAHERKHIVEKDVGIAEKCFTINCFPNELRNKARAASCCGERTETAATSHGEGPSNGQQPSVVLADELPVIRYIFTYIQVISAMFMSFSHGTNDVSHAVGPLTGMYSIYKTGELTKGHKPEPWLLLFGGLSMSIGLILLGDRVMNTIGDKLARISPAAGFCMEFGTASTILLATYLNIPVSTTNCIIGSVVFVSLIRDRTTLDWRVARNIFFSWVITPPCAALFGAAMMAIFRAIFNADHTFPTEEQQRKLNNLLLLANTTLTPLSNMTTISL